MKPAHAALLALATALISGLSIFANRVVVTGTDPLALAALKNTLVGLALLLGVLFVHRHRGTRTGAVSRLRAHWKALLPISVFGGAIPFALFFYGISLSTAINAGFIHKTLFALVAVLAFVFLKERINRLYLTAAVLFFAGLALVFPPDLASFGTGEALIALATLFWGAEIVWSKRMLSRVRVSDVLLARMLGGGVLLLFAALLFGLGGAMASILLAQPLALALVAAFLLGYVLTFYHALKWIPAHAATALLLFAIPVTAVLSAPAFGAPALASAALVLPGVLLVLYPFLRPAPASKEASA